MFKVGDKVAIVQRRPFPEMARVARVLKRFVELDDGSRWTPEGQPYPRVEWPLSHIEHWAEKHTQERHVAEALRLARNLVERLREREVLEAWQLVEELRDVLSKVEGTCEEPSES